MNDRIPRTECDRVLVDGKAQPAGWPTARLTPPPGAVPGRRAGRRPPRDPQFQVSTVPGDCRQIPRLLRRYLQRRPRL